MKKDLLPYFIFGTIYLVSGVILFASGLRASAFAGSILGLTLIVKGAINVLTRKPDDDYTRDSLMGVSLLFPGSVNLLMAIRGKSRVVNIFKGIVMLSLFAVSIYYLTLIFTLTPDSGDGVIRNTIHAGSMGLVFMFFCMIWSSLETNEYCNQRNLPYVGGTFETGLQNTKLALSVLFIVTAVIVLSLGSIYVLFT